MSASPLVRVLPTPQELFQAAAEEVVRFAIDAVRQRGRFSVALSGGSTPRGLYTLLAATARTAFPWTQTFFFWGDERHVPPDHPESNYRMVQEAMLSKVPVPTANIFRVPGEDDDAARAAETYEQTLRKFFQLRPGEAPRFDLILLGLGPDGHTASLFPGTKGLEERFHLVIANWVEKFRTDRITFTLPVLNNASCVTFLVSGADKADVLREVLEGKAPAEQYPAKLVQPTSGIVIWFLDRAAASALSTPR